RGGSARARSGRKIRINKSSADPSFTRLPLSPPALPVSARRHGRQDLAADFTFRMSLSVDVDVPLARLELPSLIWGQGRLPVDWTFQRKPLFGQPDQHGSILARLGGAVEVGHGGWA